MRDDNNLYDILQVHSAASAEVIEAAYKRLMRLYHPDVNGSPEAHEMAARLNVAYEVLGNPGRRAEYDRELEYGGRPVEEASSGDRTPSIVDAARDQGQHLLERTREWRDELEERRTPRADDSLDEEWVNYEMPQVERRYTDTEQLLIEAFRQDVREYTEEYRRELHEYREEYRRELREYREEYRRELREYDTEVYRWEQGEHKPAANSDLSLSLYRAAAQGDSEMVRSLMLAGANPYDRRGSSFSGFSPIEKATIDGHTEVVQVIADVISQGLYDYDNDSTQKPSPPNLSPPQPTIPYPSCPSCGQRELFEFFICSKCKEVFCRHCRKGKFWGLLLSQRWGCPLCGERPRTVREIDLRYDRSLKPLYSMRDTVMNKTPHR